MSAVTQYWNKQGSPFNRQKQREIAHSGRIKFSWLRGIKGCFLCGNKQLENEEHPMDEVQVAIKKLTDKQPTEILPFDDVMGTEEMCEDGQEEVEANEEVQWDEDDGETFVWMVMEDPDRVEEILAESCFL